MLPQQYCLRWKYHHSNLQTMFSQLLDRGCFCDVTLACEGQIIRAHRVVLCACSTFFDTLLSSYATEPIIIMKDAKFSDIKCLIEFMYKGEINVEHANLASLLKTAEDLKIKGLAEVSWREEEFDSTVPEPEQRFHEGALPTTPVKDNNIQYDGLNSIPQHRIPRMPLLTPIPSPVHQPDNFGPKRKRGRPPLDDSYDVFSSPKISFVKTGLGNTNISKTQSPFSDSSIVVDNQPIEDIVENASPGQPQPTTTIEAQTNTVASPTANVTAAGEHSNQEWTENYKPEVNHEEEHETADDGKSQTNDSAQSATAAKYHSKNEPNDDYDYYDQNDEKSDAVLDELDAENSFANIALTSAELEEWRDVVKMDAYLSRGRRPQFWEEPFTKRVMDAIKSKKLEMKKAAQVLGVSYGTLYGRYRETYGCLKHPYRGSMMTVNEIWLNKRMVNSVETNNITPNGCEEPWLP